jgi:DNA-binding MarR family transcriptional regulator
MTKTSKLWKARRRPSRSAPAAPVEDIALERALEGLFRLGANRRFEARQASAVGAVVTRAGYAVLRCLCDHGTLSVRQVADSAAMDAATASRQLVQLVDADLVRRTAAEDDARSIHLSLTPRGRAVYEGIVRYRLAYLSDVLEGWSKQDRTVLAGLVERLAADLAGRAAYPRTGSASGARRSVPDGPTES